MRRVVVLEENAIEQPQYVGYGRDAYMSALWEIIDGTPTSSPPTSNELLQFAMQAGLEQKRLYAAPTPPTPQSLLRGIFRRGR